VQLRKMNALMETVAGKDHGWMMEMNRFSKFPVCLLQSRQIFDKGEKKRHLTQVVCLK